MKNLKLNDCFAVVGGSKDECSEVDKTKCEAKAAKEHAKNAAKNEVEKLKNDAKNTSDKINEQVHKKLD